MRDKFDKRAQFNLLHLQNNFKLLSTTIVFHLLNLSTIFQRIANKERDESYKNTRFNFYFIFQTSSDRHRPSSTKILQNLTKNCEQEAKEIRISLDDLSYFFFRTTLNNHQSSRLSRKESQESQSRQFQKKHARFFPGVCSNATAPSVSSINRILRNRAAERAAAEFARAAGYGLYAAGPHPYFNSAHQHPTTSHHLPAGWPAPGAAGHPWMLPPLATGITGAASALLLPPSLSPGAAAAAAAAASASAAGTADHSLHADAIARGYLQGDDCLIFH